MFFKNRQSNYVKHPYKEIVGKAYQGYAEIVEEIQKKLDEIDKDSKVLCLDFYQGTRNQEVLDCLIYKLHPQTIIFSEQAKKSEAEIQDLLGAYITDDRVFGVLCHENLKSCFDDQKLEELKESIGSGLTIIYGVGASLVHPGDLHLFFDLTRWEIQLRYRSGELDNWGVKNFDEDILRKYKRGYFVEWRIFDRYKFDALDTCDYYVETNQSNQPKMISMALYHEGMKRFSSEPFRLVPYFDEGIWGGQWMKEVCDLPESKHNYAWCFDGVPEENSICFQVGDVQVDIPAINLVYAHPKELLGERVYQQFGAEFPIRFDFLDTMNGGNLSLQVHPIKEYIKEHFGMPYTQDESYYILDAQEGAHVYLGLKDDVSLDDFIDALNESQETGCRFEDENYVNNIPVQKHDHALIPAGTIHCSGSGTMVLEISATPYIFTFKLYDWGRVGLDGKPRPINVERGKENIQSDRKTQWVLNNLIHQEKIIEKGKDYQIERTGLHELEFIDTYRYSFSKEVTVSMKDSVHMCNLIEGEEIEIFSPNHEFESYRIHYVETFIIPASVKEYGMRSISGDVKVLCAEVRV